LVLDKIVIDRFLNTSEILNQLSKEINNILHQHQGGDIQDGMDLSLCLINHQQKTLSYSGARNGIIIISEGKAQRIKADLMPVGGSYIKKGKALEFNFKTQEINLLPNDWVYMYTDGFIEQIGGTAPGTTMNYKQFEQQLIDISTDEETEVKSDKLTLALDNWRGENDRTDDVLIIGFQI
jgi:serine phosphatase RsbU (regulator of sigma subunit)